MNFQHDQELSYFTSIGLRPPTAILTELIFLFTTGNDENDGPEVVDELVELVREVYHLSGDLRELDDVLLPPEPR